MTKVEDILECFHHIHHIENKKHEVHHCGGKHKKINVNLDYKICHCSCGKHSINKKEAIGHSVDENLGIVEIKFRFSKECSDGGWHIESGKIIK